MTAETKEEIDLLVDALNERASELDDYRAEELDELANMGTGDRAGITHANNNVTLLSTAKQELLHVVATLTALTRQNA